MFFILQNVSFVCFSSLSPPSPFCFTALFIGNTGWRAVVVFLSLCKCLPSIGYAGDEHRAYGWWVPGIRAANTITERLERAFTLYYRWIGSLIKKGEAGEGGRFYVNNIFRWTKTSFRGNFQNEMIRSNRNNRCQIIFKTLLNPVWQDNYLTLLIDFSKVRFPPDKTLIL